MLISGSTIESSFFNATVFSGSLIHILDDKDSQLVYHHNASGATGVIRVDQLYYKSQVGLDQSYVYICIYIYIYIHMHKYILIYNWMSLRNNLQETSKFDGEQPKIPSGTPLHIRGENTIV